MTSTHRIRTRAAAFAGYGQAIQAARSPEERRSVERAWNAQASRPAQADPATGDGKRPESIPAPVEETAEERQAKVVTLAALKSSDVTTWSSRKLGVWLLLAPYLLIAAFRPGADLSSFPREGGVPADRLAKAATWHVSTKAGADLADWTGLYCWLVDVAFPEYRRRSGRPHANEARVLWAGSIEGRDHLPPLRCVLRADGMLCAAPPLL